MNKITAWIVGGLIAGALLIGQGYMAHVDRQEQQEFDKVLRQGFLTGVDYGANLAVMHLQAGETKLDISQLQQEGWKLLEQRGMIQRVGAGK